MLLKILLLKNKDLGYNYEIWIYDEFDKCVKQYI